MAGQYARLMDTRTLGPNQVRPREQVLDLGAFGTLVLDPRILTVGTAGNLRVETASVNEDAAFRVVATIALNAVAPMSVVTAFLRYVRWSTDGNVAGGPVVLLDLVAKDG